jgi:Tfp pilus assembly protein PilF
MMKRFPVAGVLLCTLILAVMCLAPTAFGQTSGSLQEGIRQYKADNYEEAVELFKKAREEAPQSTEAAFWLGMAYKAQSTYQDALPHLMDAVTLRPPVKEAVIELIDTLYRLGKLGEANKWLAVAERDGIYPAKTAFLRGMVQAKEGKYPESIASFEKSKTLDKNYTQAAEFQIGLSYMLARRYKQAAERFRTAVIQDPVSDLATYARRYQTLVEDRAWIERPVRLTIDLLGQYDTNMLQEPYAYPGLPDAGEEKSAAMLNTVRVDVAPIMPGSWLFNANYALSSSIHNKNSTSYDVLVNSLSVAPGYNFGPFAVNLSANYMHVLKRNPSYERYSDRFSVGPLMRFLLTEKKNEVVEMYVGYQKKGYFFPTLDPGEDQSAQGVDSYISYMRLFEKGAILILKYGFTAENAKGSNWTNRGHHLTANSIIPLREKLKLQLGAEFHRTDYLNESTIPAFNKEKREDMTYLGMAGLIWDINRNVSLMLQYTGIRDNSNIFLYDFSRSIYSVGAEFRF